SSRAGAPAGAAAGVARELAFADPDPADTHTVTVDWGDGATETFADLPVGTRSFVAQHVYAEPGVYQIAVTVTDLSGASDAATTLATTAGVTLDETGVLRIVGTSDDDAIDLRPVAAEDLAPLRETLLAEDFDSGFFPDASPSVVQSDLVVIGSEAVARGNRDGAVTFVAADLSDRRDAVFSVEIGVLNGWFEAFGPGADSLEVQVSLDGGAFVTLDRFIVDPSTQVFTGSITGQTFSRTAGQLDYAVDDAVQTAQFRIVADLTERRERIGIDEVRLRATRDAVVDAPLQAGETVRLSEDFEGPDAGDAVAWGFKRLRNGAAELPGLGQRRLAFTPADLTGLREAELTLNLAVDRPGRFSDAFAFRNDVFYLDIRYGDGEYERLDFFRFDPATGLFTGARTGQTIDPSGGDLTYALPDDAASAQLRITSRFSSWFERLVVDDVKIAGRAPVDVWALTAAPDLPLDAAAQALVLPGGGAGLRYLTAEGVTSIMVEVGGGADVVRLDPGLGVPFDIFDDDAAVPPPATLAPVAFWSLASQPLAAPDFDAADGVQDRAVALDLIETVPFDPLALFPAPAPQAPVVVAPEAGFAEGEATVQLWARAADPASGGTLLSRAAGPDDALTLSLDGGALTLRAVAGGVVSQVSAPAPAPRVWTHLALV
ncbi:MAG: PKD domain-containing protein, partial [Pseudomonadota bacterium]